MHDLYPTDWRDISYIIRDACGWTCQQCGKQCRRPGEPFDGHHRTLTCAHISQDYDAAVVTVAALCVPCHLRFDAGHSWIARQRRARVRRRNAGQLTLEFRR